MRLHHVLGASMLILAVVLTIAGCGSSTVRNISLTSSNGEKLRLEKRTADGTRETLYVHPHAVSWATTRHVETRKLPHFGLVLADGAGHSLYAFVPDGGGPNACTGACATTWPPLRITIEGTLDSSPALDESLAGTEPDPERHAVGDRIAKFAGHVVHVYRDDTAPGMATGQGVHSFGGYWYLIAPSGQLIRSSAQPPAAG
jgi:Secreted repeat of unknown function